MNASKLLAALQIYPQGHSLDADLAQKLLGEMAGPIFCGAPVPECAGLFVDLNADGFEEFVLLNAQSGRVYQMDSSGWRFVQSMSGKNDAA